MIKAEYVDHLGDDLTVVNSARVSMAKESHWDFIPSGLPNAGQSFLSAPDAKLISYLATHNHITPFTHPQITLRETIPIFVARQRFKHVVGFTYNEVSRRYVDGTPEFYVPDEWRNRPEGSIKQGSGDTNTHTEFYKGYYSQYIEDCKVVYQSMLNDGIAPEQARMVLPQSMITSYYVTGSLAAFARAYKQRIDGHAQIEIQLLAKQWDSIIKDLYPVSWSALVKTSN